MAPSNCLKTGTEFEYIGLVMVFPLAAVLQLTAVRLAFDLR
jgi:hypothetical protein